MKLGRSEEAFEDRDQAVRLSPNLAEAYLARGGSYHELGMHQKGIADRTKAIELAPDLPEAWYARGSAYYLTGEYAKSRADMVEALRLRPNYQEAADVLKKAEEKLAEAAATPSRPATVLANSPPPATPAPCG